MASSLKPFIPSFSKKLAQLNVHALSLAPYPLNYLQLLLRYHVYYLHIYCHVLDIVLANAGQQKEMLIMVDYGAGNGLLGMFAKHCGFGQVYLNDHNPVFLEGAKQLASVLNISMAGYLLGDWNEVARFFESGKKPDVIVGTDVIEHIYNLENFFWGISLLNESMVTVFTTASVTANRFKAKKLMQLQQCDELVESNAAHATPGNEYAGLPFMEVRKRLIKEYEPAISSDLLHELAVATRGLNKQDILTVLEKHRLDQIVPQPLAHLTNTCDPITGSWTERLLTVHEYRQLYLHAGFKLTLHYGFYNQWQATAKAIVLGMMNSIIVLLARNAGILSPFITLVGKKL